MAENNLEAQRLALFTEAQEFSKAPTSTERQKALCDAASWYSKARALAAKPAGSDTMVLPFGKQKSVPLKDASVDNLTWVRNAMAETLDAPEKAQWREKNVALIAAIDSELGCR